MKYGLRLSMDEKYKGLKKQLSGLSSIAPNQILLVEVFGALVKVIIYSHYVFTKKKFIFLSSVVKVNFISAI